MRYVEVGGLRLSVVGLGTWQFGSREWAYGASYARDTAPAIVRRAIGLGVTLVDTTEIYGFGRSERIIGQAIAHRCEPVHRAGLHARRCRHRGRRDPVDHRTAGAPAHSRSAAPGFSRLA